ncbi:ribosomal protein S2 [Lophiostoma macrostomum CBS 122681]|uniref:Ribosomal protein S2 n=1 Tax=Lophiostoma macrostomum CBS 122681 TaxID=1314788 RepID=A0A6A6TDJ7_9PLEO|nr:ribosomal protein S2 [Lophiostoma macrostomum CBS 122681]
MIIRSVVARSTRRALSRRSFQTARRLLSAEVDSIDASADNSLRNVQSIESQINANTDQHVPSVDPETHATSPAAQATDLVAEHYRQFKQQQQRTGHLGSEISPHYQPHTLLNNPPSPADVTLELLLASEAHQGHATSLWNPANARYIHGIRQGIHIISLEVTAAHLRRAAKVVQEVSRRGGLILFAGTRDGQDTAVVRAAQLAKGYHLFERWIPGSITNGQQILGKCKLKVVNEKDETVPGFEEQLFERPVLRPDLVVCVNPLENYVLLHECALNNIPTIGVIDTNVNPTWVTYPIPANDDSLRCIQVIAGVLGRAGEAGQKQRFEAASNGQITYRPADDLTLPEEPEADKSAAPTKPQASKPVALGGESIENADEVEAKMDDAADQDGRKLGHRIKMSS